MFSMKSYTYEIGCMYFYQMSLAYRHFQLTLNPHLLQFEIFTNKTVVIQFRAHDAFLK